MLSFYLTGFYKLITIGKKVFLVLFVYLAIISLFLHFFIQDKNQLTYDPIKKNREKIYKVIYDPLLNESKDGKTTITMYRLIMCGFLGEACTNNPLDGNKNFKKSLAGQISNFMMIPFNNPPASGFAWIYSGLQNAGFVSKSYAAEGVGFAAIKSYSKIWTLFRDIAYILLVLIMVAIGFMIMFRMKLNPQTIISVESALPKIVLSLILITFSFPIAGFLIDLMYAIIALSISVLSKNTIIDIPVSDYQNKIFGGNGWFLFSKVSLQFGPMWDASHAIIQFIPDVLRVVIAIIISGITFFLLSKIPFGIGDLIGGDFAQNVAEGGGVWKLLWKALIGHPFGFILASILGIFLVTPAIVTLLLFFTALYVFFRIFFMLFAAYIQIILMIIFSPIILMLEAIPGRNVFAGWFKNLLVTLLTFPMVVILLIIGVLITRIPQTGDSIWAPPFLPGENAETFGALIGLGLMFMIPDLVKFAKEALGVKPSPLSPGIGTFFAGVGAAWGGTQAGLGGLTSLGQLPFVGQKILTLAREKKLGPLSALFPKSYQETLLEDIRDKKSGP